LRDHLRESVPFYQLSKTDLAPDEDQGMIIAIGRRRPMRTLTSWDYSARSSGSRAFRNGANDPDQRLPASNQHHAHGVDAPGQTPTHHMQLLPEVTRSWAALAGMYMLAFLRAPAPGARRPTCSSSWFPRRSCPHGQWPMPSFRKPSRAACLCIDSDLKSTRPRPT